MCPVSSPGRTNGDRNGEITIPVPWGSICGKTYGNAEHDPVLCVHGKGDNQESFRHLLSLLPRHYFYVCIDLPGHGRSSHAHKGYILDLLWYVMCVKRVVDHFRWRHLYYMGHSLGGYIGYFLAAIYPELVGKLFVLDTLFYDHIPSPSTVQGLRRYLFDPTFKLESRSGSEEAPSYSFAEILQKMRDSRLTEVEGSSITSMVERNLDKVGHDRYKSSYDQRVKVLGPVHFTLGQLENVSCSIRCPTLVILGKNSLATVPHEKLRPSPLNKNSNVVLRVVDGDHDVHISHPERVAELISPLLAQPLNVLKNLESKL